MKKRIILACLLLISALAFGIDKTSPAYRTYAKGMFSYYIFSDINLAAGLFQNAVRKDGAFLGGYLGLIRSYVKILDNENARKTLDNAWEACRQTEEREALIIAKFHFLHDELNDKANAGAFIRQTETNSSLRYLKIFKRRFQFDKNVKLTMEPLKLGNKTYHFSGAEYKRSKLFFLFWHPDVVNITAIIRKWYPLARKLGYTPFLFTPVKQNHAFRFLRKANIPYPAFTSNAGQDIAARFGVDIVPQCIFMGKDNEILFAGHPEHLNQKELNILSSR